MSDVQNTVRESEDRSIVCSGTGSRCMCAENSVIGQETSNSKTVCCAVQSFDNAEGGTLSKTGRGGQTALSFDKLS